jgi:hypothetical protein
MILLSGTAWDNSTFSFPMGPACQDDRISQEHRSHPEFHPNRDPDAGSSGNHPASPWAS